MKSQFLQIPSLIIALVLVISACIQEDELECENNQTATVRFANFSNTNSTYDIIWNGAKVATVTPRDTTKRMTVAANVEHTLEFKITNTQDLACSGSNPVLSQCSARILSCTG